MILGVKVRLERNLAGENDLAALRLAKEAADAVRLPLMVHIGNTHSVKAGKIYGSASIPVVRQ